MTLKYLLAGLLLIAVFCAGTIFGIYYANELAVLIKNHTGLDIFPSSTNPQVQSALRLNPEAVADQSFIKLPNLPDPLPLIYSDTLEEAQIQEYLKQGAVVLPLGTVFGEPGNVVVTAHSSGSEAFGPFRFAFAQLSELKTGDEYQIITPQKTLTYRVWGNDIVWPHEVDKLPKDDRSTVTLVTCWPLWTNFKRLLVHSELVN